MVGWSAQRRGLAAAEVLRSRITPEFVDGLGAHVAFRTWRR